MDPELEFKLEELLRNVPASDILQTVNRADVDGNTPILSAFAKGCMTFARALADKGANLLQSNKVRSADELDLLTVSVCFHSSFSNFFLIVTGR